MTKELTLVAHEFAANVAAALNSAGVKGVPPVGPGERPTDLLAIMCIVGQPDIGPPIGIAINYYKGMWVADQGVQGMMPLEMGDPNSVN